MDLGITYGDLRDFVLIRPGISDVQNELAGPFLSFVERQVRDLSSQEDALLSHRRATDSCRIPLL